MSSDESSGNGTSIGERLREERERLHLDQGDLASRIGAGRTSVLAWEKGSRSPGIDVMPRMAELGMDVLYVLTGRRTPTPHESLSPEEKALLDNYQNADEDGRAAARRILDALAQPARKKA